MCRMKVRGTTVQAPGGHGVTDPDAWPPRDHRISRTRPVRAALLFTPRGQRLGQLIGQAGARQVAQRRGGSRGGELHTAAGVLHDDRLLLKGEINKAGKLYVKGPKGQFAGPLSTGSMQQAVITQPPGVYVILCAMNAQDGRDHFQLGMFRAIRIKR